jgi:hypothetical protein
VPTDAAEANSKTRKANTGSRSRQWAAVYEGSRARGDDEGTAHAKASGVVKKNWKKTNPARRKPVDHRPGYMKAAHDGFLKAAGVQRLKRLVSARRKGKPVQEAIERSSDKIKRRGSRYTRDVMEEGHMSAARALHPSPPLSAGSNLASYEDKTRHHFTSMRR